MSFLFIELPKINLSNLPVESNRKNWLKFFSEIKDGTVTVSSEITDYQPTNKALEILEESSYSPAQLEYYDHDWDEVSRERTILGALERAHEELEVKDKVIEDKDKVIEDKDKELEANKKFIEELLKKLEDKK